MSKDEIYIAQLLRACGIGFIQEKKFTGMTYKGKSLRYDFYFQYRGRAIAVEINGRQHYEFVSHFYKKQEEWRHSLENDRRKIQYALNNGIEIYEIPYWEIENIKNIDDILQNKFRAKDKFHNDRVRQ